jgi:hypothetical protein
MYDSIAERESSNPQTQGVGDIRSRPLHIGVCLEPPIKPLLLSELYDMLD